ncbi:uncharacterized protein UV8b_07688 [Ustilaginoidea virens]|uniref:Carrier domain-containing protein n=1 Tax=Ustilaginoidea virens TaxID=1159556 RepID=A0A8E5MKR7_USTVR|nr:uncharacterized protein UV8b_07688 [Ustilaginoidea virens]QUC23447.1 hypothetical protein UV8b_07688 [Ustilaginoidea virens]
MRRFAIPSRLDTIRPLEGVTAEDENQIWTWNKTVPKPTNRCIHEWVHEQVESHPDHVAVSAWDGELTYRQLDDISTCLSLHLIQTGTNPGSFMPLCFEKSVWVSVSMLASLKAGAAFVFLDPTHPESRLRYIIKKTDATVLLSSISNASLSSKLIDRVIAVGPGLIPDPLDSTLRLPSVSPSSPMYVIFTSGSTGVPKGAIISHTAFATNVTFQADQFGFTPLSRIYDFTNHIFDDFIHYTMIGLITGCTLCVPEEKERNGNLMQSITSAKATILYLTPSVSRVLDPARLTTLETIQLGGEVVTVYDAQRWWRRGACRFVNGYGPAECTTNTVVNADAKSPEEATRIGKGSGSVTWIVHPDDHNKLLPIGMTGELVIEGPLVGIGYLKDAERTAAAFIQDPAWLLQGSRKQDGRRGVVYKTGDLVRYNQDGSLSYVGRKDTQVKIHGQRIELGEVEYQVRACVPQARRAAQVVAEVISTSGGGANVLAVFISTDQHESMSRSLTVLGLSSQAEDKLAESLPGYMIPRVFFALLEMPLTATGKTDRRKLRAMAADFSTQHLADLGIHRQSGKKRMPFSEAEKAVSALWARVLKIDETTIGIDDSFFNLGGDSMTAMQISSSARSLGLDIPTGEILHRKTIGRLCQHLIM